ncbi:hypothetical protein DPMN_177455 [Dreissena polymorpha]|uniref:IRG-type G domain-containing protein n=1 Tax=Dreissena polymorpha TaxID=45954 RepID=A0A9D4EDB2_DREPO|nr:hypothetical protein DPMN_177455 [Dreissena polymorpha]
MAEAVVIQTILDNDQSRTTNIPAIKNVFDHSQSTSAMAAAIQKNIPLTKERVDLIKQILGLHRQTESKVVVNQKVIDQAKLCKTEIKKVPYQTENAAFRKLAGLANADTIEKVLDPVEAETFQKVMDQCWYSELMQILEDSKNSWRDSTIHIAITGESGSGKSSLINALSERKDDDHGAAHTDCIEATKEPTAYPHPRNKNRVLWDLPGVGTPSFPKDTYIEDSRFDQYNFIILVSCSRYTNNDAWLAQQIISRFPGENLMFVRTKIDNDLKSRRKGRRIPMSEDEIKTVFDDIKQNCFTSLKSGDIKQSSRVLGG